MGIVNNTNNYGEWRNKAESKVKNGIAICAAIKSHFVEIATTNLSSDTSLNISRELFKGVSNIALEYRVAIYMKSYL